MVGWSDQVPDILSNEPVSFFFSVCLYYDYDSFFSSSLSCRKSSRWIAISLLLALKRDLDKADR